MTQHRENNVDVWLKREADHVRSALERASRHFDENDTLTVNLLEAVYARESSFGAQLGQRGSDRAAGHFQLKPDTARRYGLTISEENDQRFDIDYASSAGARYLKDLHTFYSRETTLIRGLSTVAVKDPVERKKPLKAQNQCTEGHWVTIDERPMFICD